MQKRKVSPGRRRYQKVAIIIAAAAQHLGIVSCIHQTPVVGPFLVLGISPEGTFPLRQFGPSEWIQCRCHAGLGR